ncbi:hypothetical protein KIPB_000115, partial [Kipferlia bialata]|eukprot:g115.t1
MDSSVVTELTGLLSRPATSLKAAELLKAASGDAANASLFLSGDILAILATFLLKLHKDHSKKAVSLALAALVSLANASTTA